MGQRREMTRCLRFSVEYFNRNKEKEREVKEGERRKERRSECGQILIMLNLGDGLYEVHHIILLLCIFEIFH